MPSKPPDTLESQLAQVKELDRIADQAVDEETLNDNDDDDDEVVAPPPPTNPIDLTKKEARFYSLFDGNTSKQEVQGSLPDDVDLDRVHSASTTSEEQQLLAGRGSTEGETKEEAEAKKEDLARRQAYIEIYAEEEAKRSREGEYEKKHRKYIGIFGQQTQQK